VSLERIAYFASWPITTRPTSLVSGDCNLAASRRSKPASPSIATSAILRGMQTKLDKLKAARAAGDTTEAIGTAARFARLGQAGPVILRTHQAQWNPCSIGRSAAIPKSLSPLGWPRWPSGIGCRRPCERSAAKYSLDPAGLQRTIAEVSTRCSTAAEITIQDLSIKTIDMITNTIAGAKLGKCATRG